MHSFARFQADIALRLANERVHAFQAEAARARIGRPDRTAKAGSFLATLRAAFTTPSSSATSPLPRLTDYPVRS